MCRAARSGGVLYQSPRCELTKSQAHSTASAATAPLSSASAGPTRAAPLDVLPLEGDPDPDPDPVLVVVPDAEPESALPLGVPAEPDGVGVSDRYGGWRRSCAPEPPATVDSCANPTDAGEERKTEYTFFYGRGLKIRT